MASSWLKIQGIVNEKQLSIIEDGAYIKTYEKKGADLEEKIKHMKEELDEFKLKNKELEYKLPVLEIDYETAMKNLPIYSKMYRRARERLGDLQMKNKAHKEKLNSNVQKARTECKEIIAEYEIFVPGWKEYQVEVTKLKQLELDDKIIQQAIDDQMERIALKKEIQRKLFNDTIIDFVQKVVTLKERVEVQRKIKEMENTGNKLLKIYQKKLAENERRQKSCDSTDYLKDLHTIKMISLPPVEIKQAPLPKASPALSTTSVRSNNKKFLIDEAEKKKIKQRIIKNKNILNRLSSNENVPPLENSAVPSTSPSKNKAVVSEEIFKQPEPADKLKVLQQVVLTPKTISRKPSQSDILKTPEQNKKQGLKRAASANQLATPKKFNMGFGNITKPINKYKEDQEHFSQLIFKERAENSNVNETDFYKPQFSKSTQELQKSANQEISSQESAKVISQEHNSDHDLFKMPYRDEDLFETNFEMSPDNNEINTSNPEMNNTITKNDTFLDVNNSFGPFSSDFSRDVGKTFNLLEEEKKTILFL